MVLSLIHATSYMLSLSFPHRDGPLAPSSILVLECGNVCCFLTWMRRSTSPYCICNSCRCVKFLRIGFVGPLCPHLTLRRDLLLFGLSVSVCVLICNITAARSIAVFSTLLEIGLRGRIERASTSTDKQILPSSHETNSNLHHLYHIASQCGK